MYTDEKENPISGDLERYDIRDYISTFLIELAELERNPIKLRTIGEASRIKELLNIPENTTFKSTLDFRSGEPYWHRQEVDFTPSNLGRSRGFIFYFICNGCSRRTKYLYSHSLLCEPRCRQCYHLPYRQLNRKTRSLSRLIHKDYLPSEAKYMLMKKLNISRNDIDNYLSDFDDNGKRGII